jgi:hypothetical protein
MTPNRLLASSYDLAVRRWWPDEEFSAEVRRLEAGRADLKSAADLYDRLGWLWWIVELPAFFIGLGIGKVSGLAGGHGESEATWAVGAMFMGLPVCFSVLAFANRYRAQRRLKIEPETDGKAPIYRPIPMPLLLPLATISVFLALTSLGT